MTKLFERRGNALIIDRGEPHEFDGKCELCGAQGELRPFGPNNESICFDCGMKDQATTNRKIGEMMNPQ
jgi:hypothetical protein